MIEGLELCATPVLLNGQPKAGTFLYNEMVSTLGFEAIHIHLGRNGPQAYDRSELERGWNEPSNYSVKIPFEESIKLIRKNQMTTSHFTYSEKRAELLEKFKIIMARRELRSGLTSFARMCIETKDRNIQSNSSLKGLVSENGYLPFLEAYGERYINRSLKIFQWVKKHKVLSLAFKDLKSNPVQQIQSVISFLNVEKVIDCDQIYQNSLLTSTFTRTSGGCLHSWGEPEEVWFDKVGSVEANRELGYESR